MTHFIFHFQGGSYFFNYFEFLLLSEIQAVISESLQYFANSSFILRLFVLFYLCVEYNHPEVKQCFLTDLAPVIVNINNIVVILTKYYLLMSQFTFCPLYLCQLVNITHVKNAHEIFSISFLSIYLNWTLTIDFSDNGGRFGVENRNFRESTQFLKSECNSEIH